MGWKDWSSDSEQTVEEITTVIDQMHREEARDAEEHKGDKR